MKPRTKKKSSFLQKRRQERLNMTQSSFERYDQSNDNSFISKSSINLADSMIMNIERDDENRDMSYPPRTCPTDRYERYDIPEIILEDQKVIKKRPKKQITTKKKFFVVAALTGILIGGLIYYIKHK